MITMTMIYVTQVTGKRNLPELSLRDCEASIKPLTTHSGDAAVIRRREKTNCAGDRDSVSSLPSTLAAYIREEHKNSGGTDRCLTEAHSYF